MLGRVARQLVVVLSCFPSTWSGRLLTISVFSITRAVLLAGGRAVVLATRMATIAFNTKKRYSLMTKITANACCYFPSPAGGTGVKKFYYTVIRVNVVGRIIFMLDMQVARGRRVYFNSSTFRLLST